MRRDAPPFSVGRPWRTGLALGCCHFLLACGQAGFEDWDSSQSAIVHGEASGPADDSVLSVRGKSATETLNCSGTLVAANLVLTARHCVSEYIDEPFSCTSSGELVPTAKDGGKMGAMLEPSAVSVRVGVGPQTTLAARGLQLFGVATPSVCRNDIALILLDTPLEELPIARLRLFRGTEPQEAVRIVGYGFDENDEAGVRLMRDGLRIGQVGESEFRNPGDAVPPRTFVVEGAAACHGDSGGPALSEEGAVVGVFSTVVGACTAKTARNYYTEVAPFADQLLLPAFEAAGAEPWIEGNSGPGLGASANAGGSSNSAGGAAEGGAPTMTDSGGASGEGANDADGGATEPLEPTDGGADASGSGGSNETHGPRKKGGCTCGIVGASSDTKPPYWLLGFVLLAGRRRRRA